MNADTAADQIYSVIEGLRRHYDDTPETVEAVMKVLSQAVEMVEALPDPEEDNDLEEFVRLDWNGRVRDVRLSEVFAEFARMP